MAREKKQKKAKKPKGQGRIAQLRQSWTMTRKVDPRMPLVVAAWAVGVAAVTFLVFGVLLPGILAVSIVLAVFAGLLAGLIVFGRRAERGAYAQIEGQPGAAAAVLDSLKRGYKTDTAVAFTKQQDIVHRVVGPAGIVLVGEGNGNRLKQLLASERRRHERISADVSLSTVVVGRGEGEVPLPDLRKRITKQKRTLKPAEMTDVLSRLRALDAHRPPVGLPKGPLPTSMKGMRSQMRGR
ncbi:DUF4191 domain-containing protein [Nocardioidaceae bacterium]|nr:DUF4191 domain-containing protein [Nocardioidaceae bacterium]